MPIQIWTDANLPARLKAQGGQALAAGIAGAGQSIGAALEKAMEEKKRLAQQGKAADAFFKSLPEGQTPMSPEDWALRSPREKVSVMTGLFEAQGYQKAQAELGRALEEAAARRAEASRLTDFNTRTALSPTITPEILLQNAAQSGVLGNRAIDIDALMRASGGGQDEPFFNPGQFGTAFPVTTPDGKVLPGIFTTPLGPRQSQVVSDPSAALQTQEITDAQGNVHTVLVPPRGQPQFPPRAQRTGSIEPVDLHKSLSAEINAILRKPLLEQADRDELKRLRAERDKLESGAGRSGPKVGAVEDGYRFKGGNPADPASWEKVK